MSSAAIDWRRGRSFFVRVSGRLSAGGVAPAPGDCESHSVNALAVECFYLFGWVIIKKASAPRERFDGHTRNKHRQNTHAHTHHVLAVVF